MFFTQALQGFGPVGTMAQTALAGIGGAIMGGGGVLAALSLAKVGVELLADAWGAEGKAAEEAAKKSLEAAKAIADGMAQKAAAEQGRLDEATFTPRQLLDRQMRESLAKVNAELAASRSRTGDDVISEETNKLLAERTRLMKEYAKAKAAMEGNAEVAQVNAATGKKVKTFDELQAEQQKASADRQKATNEYMARVRAELAADVEAANERGRLMLAEQELERNRTERLAAAAKKVQGEWVATGDAIAGAFSSIGSVLGGAAQSWMAYFGQLIQKAIQLAIAMSATGGPLGWLNAAAAGFAVISAVTAVPEFRAMGGPVRSGSPYIVGEQGPELFVPSQSGGIVPNHAMGGVTVNINAVDAQGVRRLLLDNGPALAEAIGKAARDGRRFG